ncbi:hypothetical protein [Bradyrhizobium sp. RDM12]
MTIMRQHEVDTFALEVTVEDQVGIGNDKRALGHVAMPLGGKGIDVIGGGRTGTLAIQGERGVKLASVIQPGTVKRVKIYVSMDRLSLHSITKSLAKPSIACVISHHLATDDYVWGDIHR